MIKKKIACFLIAVIILSNSIAVFAQDTIYPDYAEVFLGRDKCETYNRKMFNFNQGLNQYVIRPIHILWSSIMPEYGMDRLRYFSNNIEFPIRAVSSLIQRDFRNAGNETKRFLINTTIGLAGLYDPARHILKIEQSRENMDQALEKCKIKPGPFFVVPILYFTTVRGLFGRLLDMALNPSFYIGTPVLAAVKFCLVINRTSYFQPLLKMIESNYADPYEVRKIAFAIDMYIKRTNMDRVDIKPVDLVKNDNYIDISAKKDRLKVQMDVLAEIAATDTEYSKNKLYEIIEPNLGLVNIKLEPDIVLEGYNPQSPVVDSMRTALFTLPNMDKSIWNELSIWNRSFLKRIKISSVKLAEGRDKYKFRYIMQSNKDAPLAIIYPSIGEGISSGHSSLMAKVFYDCGYSVIIEGSPFQWEFVKSMPDGYCPGNPSNDADAMILTTSKIIDKFTAKGYKFPKKVVLGTSFGALTSLFMGAKEYEHNTLGDTQYIAICPPIDLIYAMKQVDKYTIKSDLPKEELQELVGMTSAKILRLYQIKKDIKFVVNYLPFTEQEAKLITGFIMHQKLSDLVFVLEKAPNNHKSNIYEVTNNMGYQDYAEKYLLNSEDKNVDNCEFGLMSIVNYLDSANNYKIYHSMTDYLTTKTHLKQLKQVSGSKTVLLDNGAHLGFLYRKEFYNDLRKTILSAKQQSLNVEPQYIKQNNEQTIYSDDIEIEPME